MVLTLVVCKIFLSGEIFDVKLLLSNSIHNPEASHLHGAQALVFFSVVGDSNCGRIITVDWGGRLRMTHFFKCESNIVACLQFRNYALGWALSTAATRKGSIEQSVTKAPFNFIGFVGFCFQPMKK